jgi:hypothetical protein
MGKFWAKGGLATGFDNPSRDWREDPPLLAKPPCGLESGGGLKVVDIYDSQGTHSHKLQGREPKLASLLITFWSGRGDLNPRPQRPERCALTKLRYSPRSPTIVVKAVRSSKGVVRRLRLRRLGLGLALRGRGLSRSADRLAQ